MQADDQANGNFQLRPEQTAAQQRLALSGDIRDGAAPKPARRRKDTARLVWDSKPKRPPSPRDIEFQTAEVVIPNPARDAGTLPFSFRDGILHNKELDRSRMNRLIWGDNLLAMQALLATGYEGKIDLIYIDPPFVSSGDYSHRLSVGATEITREPSIIERLAYRDTWDAGRDSYLDMLYPRLQLMRRLLSEAGSIYVHIGPQMNHLVRILLDETFGIENARREIVWQRVSSRGHGDYYPATHDSILFYTKGDQPIWNQQFLPLDPEYVATKYRFSDPDGRRFRKDNCLNQNRDRPNLTYEWNGHVRTWRWTKEKMTELHGAGRLVYTSNGLPEYKRYLDESEGVALQSIWSDVPPVNSQAGEDTGYDTQKPHTLIERILKSSSNDGSLIADFFCGSGTTATVAEKLGRGWITSDFGKVAIQVTRGRLVEADAKPFLIENIGNYQREMIYLSGGRIGEMQRIILKLYGAMPHPTYKDLGTRVANGDGSELVYVGYPDRPTTARKVEEVARSAETLDGDGYKRLIVLAWDYDYNFDAEWEARQKHAKRPLKVDVQRRMIPPDVYEYLKKAKGESDIDKLAAKIQFHEKPYLKLAKPKVGKKDKAGKAEVTVAIDRYVIFDFPVPEKEQEKLRELSKDNFAVLIDYWAVDWNYDGATFKSQWQALRGNGKKAKTVPTTATHQLDTRRTYSVAVRVVDVFGNDATGTVTVEA